MCPGPRAAPASTTTAGEQGRAGRGGEKTPSSHCTSLMVVGAVPGGQEREQERGAPQQCQEASAVEGGGEQVEGGAVVEGGGVGEEVGEQESRGGVG